MTSCRVAEHEEPENESDSQHEGLSAENLTDDVTFYRFVEPAFIRRLTVCCYAEGKGRPSIDSIVYFRMQLVAYLYSIDSDRRLCEDVYSNLDYRWFCRLSLDDKVPDHSSFSTIRDRYGEEIYEQVFTEIAKLCLDRYTQVQCYGKRTHGEVPKVLFS